MVERILSDPWSPCDYKFRGETDGRIFGVPSWVGDHVRRLMAYGVYKSYVDNTSRQWLSPPDAYDEVAGRDPDDHREYGDPALIVKTILGGLLGSEQTITVDGAELFQMPEGEILPPGVDDLNEDPPLPPGGDNSPEVTRSFELQQFLRDWAVDSHLWLKMVEVERDTITLGDGVYVLGWSNSKGRVNLKKYDPSYYFPVLDDYEVDDDYPTRVHIAWEIPPDPYNPEEAGVVKIRRITYEIVDLKDDEPSIAYPYNPGKRSRKKCVLSDGIWTLDSMVTSIDDLHEQRVKWLKNDDGEIKRKLDLGIDFIPVVHMPNTVAEEEHFGRSSLAEVLQVLDDLAAADTDLQAASATTGTPVIALSGINSGDTITSYGPGSVFEVGEGGMDMLDTSKSLTALLDYVKSLLTRLAVNSRVPEAALGRINASQVPSGIALALSYSPMEQMVKEMRQVRDEKYPLLLKFVLRMSMVAGRVGPGPMPRARVAFGSFLPTDRSAIVNEVQALLTASAISTRTAVLLLINAGFPIDDAAKEVQRIQSLLTLKAVQIAQATGSYPLAAEFLGIDPSKVGAPNTGVQGSVSAVSQGVGGNPVSTANPTAATDTNTTSTR